MRRSNNSLIKFRMLRLSSFIKKITKRTVYLSALLATAPQLGVAATHFAGTTVGDFQVGQNGDASYAIPITVPPGIKGMQPNLALTYSSQSGNGLLGMGWNLSGLSAVTRCPQTLAQDNNIHGVDFTAEDRFCLDGQRLVPVVAGSNEYRTEMESYSNITAIGGTAANPAWFEVRTKDGKIKEYGNTSDSFVNAIDATDGAVLTDARMWTINKISDRSTNYVDFVYIEDLINGDHYISQINYTGNVNAARTPFSSVQFLYELRSDKNINYMAGTKSSMLNRLINIQTLTVGATVNDYKITYKPYVEKNHSQLSSLTQCDANNQCLESVSFGWVTDNDSVNVEYNLATSIPVSTGYYLGHSNRTQRLHVADFNGDGIADLLNVTDTPGSTGNTVYLSNGQGYDPIINVPVAAGYYLGHSNNTQRLMVADFNGDGMADLLNVTDGSGSTNNSLYLSNGSGFELAINGSVPVPAGYYLGHSNRTQRLQVADFNGDGMFDLLNTSDVSGSTNNQLYLSNGQGFDSIILESAPVVYGYYLGHSNNTQRLTVADFNGDGMADLLNTTDGDGSLNNQLYLSNGQGFEPATIGSVPVPAGYYLGHSNRTQRLQVADFNGDGMSDLLNTSDVSGSTNNQLYLSNGAGFNSAILESAPVVYGYYLGHSNNTQRLTVADFNGDGMADLLNTTDGYDSNNNALYLSNGQGFESAVIGSVPVAYGNYLGHSNYTQRLQLGDFDGDGLVDLLNTTDANGSTSNTLYINKSLSSQQISNIKNGFGELVNITYKPLTDSFVYTPDMASTECVSGEVICTQFPMYVVSSYNKSNGKGGLYSHSYKYSGVKRNILGRGSLGFASVTMTDDQTNVASQKIYRQDFPFVGVTASSVTQQQNGTPISKTVNSWFDLYGSDPTRTRFNVKMNSSDSYSYELNGSQITHVTTTNTYGGELGEVTTLLVNSNDGYTKTSTNAYYPADTVNWRISQLNTISVISLTPTNAGTRKSEFKYNVSNGLVQSETIEPGNIELEVTKTYIYDIYGNKISTTVSGNAGAENKFTARTSTVNYDYNQLVNASFPQVSITSSNALAHSSTKVIDARYGKVIKTIGSNGIVTNWQYDSLGRQIKELRADGSNTAIDYQICEVGTVCADAIQDYLQSPLAVKTTVTDGISSNATTVYFDVLGREVLKTNEGFNGKTIRKKTEYDLFGRVSKISLPYFSELSTHNALTDPYVYWTSYQYDVLGRMKVESKADNSVTTVVYNGLSTTTTNNFWQSITKVKNSQGQLVTSIDPFNNSNTYTYDAFGKMLSVTDALGHVSRMSYDIRGHKVSMQDVDMGNWTYVYNALGELVSQTDAKLQITSITYDVLGRISGRSQAEGISTWLYDLSANGKGKLSSVTGPNGYTRTHSYDTLGRPVTTTVNYDNTNYATSNTYFANTSRLSTVTFPVGQVLKYSFDAFGYMNQIVDGTSNKIYWKPEFTNAFGKVTQEVIGEKIITTKTYKATTGRLESIKSGLTASSSTIQNLTYVFDTLGNLTSRYDSNNVLTEIFTYDDLNRLITTQMNSLPQKTFSYDANGNITNKSDIGAYIYDNGAGVYTTLTGGPHAVHKVGSNTYSYDLNGNQISGAGRTLTYTSFNKPVTIVNASTSNSIYYDVDYKRIEKISTTATDTITTFYLGNIYQQVKNSSGLIEDKYFISAGGATVLITKRSTNNNDIRYLLKDHIGSSDIITDELGVLVQGENLSFDAWGKRRQANWADATSPILSLSTIGFTGHEMDDGINLINMNARMYDAEIGRFLSPDTYVQFPASTQGMNRYTYVNNNPLSYTDPTGNFLDKEFKEIGKFFDKQKESIARAFTMGWLAPFAYAKPVKDLFIREEWARQAGSIIATAYGGEIGSAGFSAYITDISGGSVEDIAKNAALAYVTTLIINDGVSNELKNYEYDNYWDLTKKVVSKLTKDAAKSEVNKYVEEEYGISGIINIYDAAKGNGGEMLYQIAKSKVNERLSEITGLPNFEDLYNAVRDMESGSYDKFGSYVTTNGKNALIVSINEKLISEGVNSDLSGYITSNGKKAKDKYLSNYLNREVGSKLKSNLGNYFSDGLIWPSDTL